MAHYVVVRGQQSDISARADEANGTDGSGIAPVTAAGGEVVEIVAFDDQGDAIRFSQHRPTTDADGWGTVFSEDGASGPDNLKAAENFAIRKAEGH